MINYEDKLRKQAVSNRCRKKIPHIIKYEENPEASSGFEPLYKLLQSCA